MMLARWMALLAVVAGIGGAGCGGDDEPADPPPGATSAESTKDTTTEGTQRTAPTTANKRRAARGVTCENLPLTHEVRGQLLDGDLPDKDSVFYGRCGSTRWALGGYTTDGHHHFSAFRRKRGDRSWVILSSSSNHEAWCTLPKALLRVWDREQEEC